jgi:hypothetical protein
MDAPLNDPEDVADAAAAELRRLHGEVERLRTALNVASGALLQCEPCMADECAQVQREWLDDARRLIDAALKETK